jgi:phosphoglycerate dehydrogenase-like enzyme
MSRILARAPLSKTQIETIHQEFPHFDIIQEGKTPLSRNDWLDVEVIFSNVLSAEELTLAPKLRWIHSPNENLKGLCLEEIHKFPQIILTYTAEEHGFQVAEFVNASILAFSKNLFFWSDRTKLKDQCEEGRCLAHWQLKGRILVQVGLGSIGSEVVKMAEGLNMRMIGVQHHRSFHPDCRKIIDPEHLHSVLPVADVVVLAMPLGTLYQNLFSSPEFKLMKDDAIFIAIDSSDLFDQDALKNELKEGRFRGVVLDDKHLDQASFAHLNQEASNLIITPGIAATPHAFTTEVFQHFRRNLRQFVHGTYSEMRAPINWTSYLHSEIK